MIINGKELQKLRLSKGFTQKELAKRCNISLTSLKKYEYGERNPKPAVVDRLIREETHCGDEIVYHIDKPFDQMDNVIVVTLNDKNKNITYVFESGVFLLNSKGQTVQKLA